MPSRTVEDKCYCKQFVWCTTKNLALENKIPAPKNLFESITHWINQYFWEQSKFALILIALTNGAFFPFKQNIKYGAPSIEAPRWLNYKAKGLGICLDFAFFFHALPNRCYDISLESLLSGWNEASKFVFCTFTWARRKKSDTLHLRADTLHSKYKCL